MLCSTTGVIATIGAGVLLLLLLLLSFLMSSCMLKTEIAGSDTGKTVLPLLSSTSFLMPKYASFWTR